MIATQEIGFADKFQSAITLVESLKTIVIKTALDFKSADEKLKLAREFRKELEAQYKVLPAIIEAKRLQGIKVDLDAKLEKFIKDLKNGPMLAYEQAEEAKRIAEERRLAKIEQDKIDKENARLAKIEADKKAIADKEAARLAAIAAKTRDQAKKEQALRDAAAAAQRAKDAAIEQQRIKDEAAAAPKVVVVLEKTAPTTANRRVIPKFRVTNESIVPRQYFTRDDVKIGGVIRSLRANHGIPGIEYYEELA